MKVYVVTMYRGGDREKHSYVCAVFTNKERAKKWGEDEEFFRTQTKEHKRKIAN